MTGNLAEFIKVFFIVFSFSAGILALRRFMLSYDQEQQEVEDKKAEVINLPKKAQGSNRPKNYCCCYTSIYSSV